MIDDSPEIQTTQAAAPSPQSGTAALDSPAKSVSRPRSESKSEIKSEPKPDGRSEAKSDTKSDTKPEAKVEAKSDKAEAKTESRGADASEAQAETDAGPDAPPAEKSDAKPRSKAKGSRGTKSAGASATKGARAAEKAANAAIEARIGHHFADPSLLSTAVTHVSALKSSKKRGDSYQRLEFLGDHVLGLIVSPVCLFFVSTVKNSLGYDDALDVFGVHCIGGIIGALATGILVNPALGGVGITDYTNITGNNAGTYDFATQMLAQVKAVVATLVWSGVGSAILYKVVDVVIGL
ncbi:MAG: hypothetical protein E6614_32440, partial [Bradyrhizobium sp.]|nr:hypothetical protein [Bradyrhizobium sp.]